MARDSGNMLGSVLKWGLVLGGGYLAYRAISSSAQPSSSGSLSLADLIAAIQGSSGTAAASGGGSTAAPAKPAEPAAADMVTALKAAAAGNSFLVNGKMNQDQWNFYRNQLWPPDLTGTQLGSAFPNGPEQVTAEEFVARLHTVGLAGLGLGSVRIPVPTIMRAAGGKPVLVWMSRELPGSGPTRIAVFPNSHPFTFGARPLPVRSKWGEA